MPVDISVAKALVPIETARLGLIAVPEVEAFFIANETIYVLPLVKESSWYTALVPEPAAKDSAPEEYVALPVPELDAVQLVILLVNSPLVVNSVGIKIKLSQSTVDASDGALYSCIPAVKACEPEEYK